ncbi:MAG: hydantoinase B/oxoprolinase family protein, partial [Deltaproteobacteria bacterium]|nr:hydantoinase B/oxoprolinase family protein [Deltaproteobacteria bacterium]
VDEQEVIEPGDVIISNDPDSQGQHLNNVVVMTPIYFEHKLIAFSCVRAHWQDIGGATVGSTGTRTTDIFQEGLQLRAIKVYQKGAPNKEVLKIIRSNSRFPEITLGDFNSQMAACKLGERRLSALLTKYGLENVTAAIHEGWDMSEKAARAALREIPRGEYGAESFLDNDGVELEKTVEIKVRIKVESERMIIDFSEIADQVKGPINSGYYGGALNVARIAFKCLTTPHHPSDEGCFRPLEVICPKGKMLNARPPAALAHWSVPFPTILDTIFKALSEAIPRRIPAATRGDARGVGVTGYNEAQRKFFHLSPMHMGGHGARPGFDGPAPKCAIQQGDEHAVPIEVSEIKSPVIFDSVRLRQDSGGAGKFRGGLGIDVVFSLEIDGKLRNMMIRSRCLPWGVYGGKNGAANEAYRTNPDGTEERLPRATDLPLPAGQKVLLRTGGGGGFGDPLEREEEKVLDDVLNGYVSLRAAEEDYGVVIDSKNFCVDKEATEARRKAMRGVARA